MSQARSEKVWIGRVEACRRLGISSHTFTDLVRAGRIGSLSLPGIRKRSYRASDVDALVIGGTVPAKGREELVGV
jgi:excisionase family DNA binding protein